MKGNFYIFKRFKILLKIFVFVAPPNLALRLAGISANHVAAAASVQKSLVQELFRNKKRRIR